jgi:alpha-1,3-rhamnosyl/mannosyltransferase
VRIGIDAGQVLAARGGVATYTREIVKGLAAPEVNDEIVLYDLEGRMPRRALFEQAVGPLPARVVVGNGSDEELQGLDLFHAPAFAMPPPGARRHLLTLHDLTVMSHPECHTIGNRVRTLTSLAEALSRGATLLAVSEATRREAQRLLAIPPTTVEVLPPFVNPIFSPAGRAQDDLEVAQQFGIRRPFALVVGSLEPRKNLSRLLDAWSQLPAAMQSAHQLVVVGGEGWKELQVRRRLRAMVRDGSVVHAGFIAESWLAALYRQTRAFVFPSIAEGFGLPVAEAMACGAPVLTSDRSSLPEVAGEAAILVDPENTEDLAAALQSLLEDRELRQRLREASLERAPRHSSAVLLPELRAIYQRAASA